ncbi:MULTISPECIES: hypothetical protein [unclassified Shewanella]|uniref:hypothetical protein n=1 Tax=unclassified Shewanella TaxID=196818 RepID=UPI001BBC0F7C|nr:MULTISPECIES: hypothetical protein [unclassified Shewanella]GIU14638.1 hypothetical protein TUM4444_24630 [Shewanella sp. MBTL60-112-B1]GIU37826.1 hypothetical protein TUM4445_30920 [Shewanella sp. MBTL60-112-B2]
MPKRLGKDDQVLRWNSMMTAKNSGELFLGEVFVYKKYDISQIPDVKKPATS